MHLLFVTSWVPYPPKGAKAREFHFLRHLARRHRVTCFCLLPPHEDPSGAESLRRLGIEVHLISKRTAPLARLAASFRMWIAGHVSDCAEYFEPRLFAALSRAAAADAADPVDAVQMQGSLFAPYLEAIPLALRPRVHLDEHNVATTVCASLASLPVPPLVSRAMRRRAARMHKWEAAAVGKFGAVSVASRHDAEWVCNFAGGVPVHLIPNGVAPREIQLLPQRADSRRLVFAGPMGYHPNAYGAVWFCDAVLPLLRKRFSRISVDLVGPAPTAAVRALTSHPGVRVVDVDATADLVSFYDDAAVAIVPLLASGGNQPEILEAMARGRAVVATHAGCERLEVKDGEHLLIGDEPESFAAHVAALLEDVTTRESLAARARAFVAANHDWDALGVRLVSHIEALATQP